MCYILLKCECDFVSHIYKIYEGLPVGWVAKIKMYTQIVIYLLYNHDNNTIKFLKLIYKKVSTSCTWFAGRTTE